MCTWLEPGFFYKERHVLHGKKLYNLSASFETGIPELCKNEKFLFLSGVRFLDKRNISSSSFLFLSARLFFFVLKHSIPLPAHVLGLF